VKTRRLRFERLAWIGDHREILVHHANQVQRLRRDQRILSHDRGNLIADETHDVGAGPLRTRTGPFRTTQHRLIRILKAILVNRHIPRREDGDNTGQNQGS